MNPTIKKTLPYLGIIAAFIMAAAIYFLPALQGKVIYAGDSINAKAAVQESVQFRQETGDNTWWNGAMFSGMPNYQIGGGRNLATQILLPCYKVLQHGPHNAALIFFFYLIAFFVLLRTFKIDKWLSMAGAFATAMSSYFFIIIAAQHGGKTVAITWMTLVLVGFLLIYRKQYGLGAILTMFFIPMGFFIHPQMSYYICMLIGLLFFAELANAYKAKEWKHFGIATAVFFASFAVGMGIGSANVFANMEYAEQTMRGGHSDLEKDADETNKTKGLDLDYATAWSYGINETMTLIIPNYMGGASGYNVGTKSALYQDLISAGVPRSSAKQFCQSAPTYWGEKAFTSGAVYVGIVVFLLFLLGLIILQGPYKWALLIATLFSIVLAWGHHFMPMTELFFNYFPMYNKFRAVESILIVAEITIPLIAFLALQKLSDDRKNPQACQKNLKALYMAGGITMAVCLIFALFGKSFMTFTSSYDAQWKAQVGDAIYQMIINQRADMMAADAWRSLAFAAVTFALLWVYLKKEFNTLALGCALTALVLVDMWPVNKRFCNDDMFVTNKKFDNAFTMQPYEKYLLENDTTHYRVLNLTTNTFNEARTSYYLKSIGGYHAAKLRRYQDLIEEHISKMNMKVIGMLNAKYFITQGQDGQIIPQRNPYAMGNAWFVDSLMVVNNANEESDALNTIDLHTTAVLDKEFKDFATKLVTPHDENAQINLLNYAPNRLEYKSQTTTDKTAVFSEIYYPYGWKATIDGVPAQHFRVNYTLRALNIPAGEHSIIFSFQPDSIRKGNTLSVICIAVMLFTMIATLIHALITRKKQTQKS